MSMQAGDLPSEIRKQILDKIREQFGDMEYNRLINSLGEDGVIDLVLKQMPKETPYPDLTPPSWYSPPVSKTRDKAKVTRYVFYIGLILAMLAGACYPDGKAMQSVMDKLFGALVGLLFVGSFVVALIIWAGSGFQSFPDVGGLYGLGLIIVYLISVIIGLIVNMVHHGIKVLEIVVIAFLFCFIIGLILGSRYYYWAVEQEKKSLRVITSITGVVIGVVILVAGWILIVPRL